MFFRDRPVILMTIGFVMVATGVAALRLGSTYMQCIDCDDAPLAADVIEAEVVDENQDASADD